MKANLDDNHTRISSISVINKSAGRQSDGHAAERDELRTLSH